MAPLKRAMVVSYRLSIVTVTLSVTIRPQFAIECLRRSNQQGVGHLDQKMSGCSPWSRPLMFKSARANIPGSLIVKLFSKNSNLCDHNPPTLQTDRRTDDMRSQDRALYSSASSGKRFGVHDRSVTVCRSQRYQVADSSIVEHQPQLSS